MLKITLCRWAVLHSTEILNAMFEVAATVTNGIAGYVGSGQVNTEVDIENAISALPGGIGNMPVAMERNMPASIAVSYDLKSKMHHTEQMMDDITTKSQKIFKVCILIHTYGDFNAQLDERVRRICSTVQQQTCRLLPTFDSEKCTKPSLFSGFLRSLQWFDPRKFPRYFQA